jgi:hypothetical protein
MIVGFTPTKLTKGVATMAETKRVTAEQVVSYLLEEEGLDFLRESLSWVVQQLMEAEVSELVGAARGERVPEERLTHRNGYRARTTSAITPWKRSSTTTNKTTLERRPGNSPPSERPTNMPTSYTTSWDLTRGRCFGGWWGSRAAMRVGEIGT